jgi:hypothetical protein
MSRMCAPRFLQAEGRLVWLTDHFPALEGGKFCRAKVNFALLRDLENLVKSLKY